MNTFATEFGSPNFSRNPAIPCEKIWKGVRPSGALPPTATAPTTISEITPRSVSREAREHYDLENLWDDAELTQIADID